MKKIYTQIELKGQGEDIRSMGGKLSTDDFELLWSMMDIVWGLDYPKTAKKYLKEIKKLVYQYESDIENDEDIEGE